MEGLETISLTYSSGATKSSDSISILVVDDDITCLSIVAALLKKFKYEVVTVKHPNDALCTLRIKGGAFDLVISDIHMPDMNGFELQQVITHEFNLPVVLMSSDNKKGTASKGLESGAAFFISKPVSPNDLRNLWQFAAMKKKSQVVIEEEITPPHQNNSDEIHALSSNVDEAMQCHKNSKRKSPSADGSDERQGDNATESAASKKKQKVIWTNTLHNRFLEAIRTIGLERAVPKKILQVMNVPGLTRENVASHLQKYRLFLKRVSDASYKIRNIDDKGLSNIGASSATICRSNISLSKPYYQNLEKFPGANSTLFTNKETSSSSPIGRHQLTSITGSLLKPHIKHPRLNGCHPSDRPFVRLPQNNFQISPLFKRHLPNAAAALEGHTNILDAPILGPTAINHSIIPQASSEIQTSGFISSLASRSLDEETSYVGYRISNIKHLTESGNPKEHESLNLCNGAVNLHQIECQNDSVGAADLWSSENVFNVDQSAGAPSCDVLVNNNDGGQLLDVVSVYLRPSNLSLPENMETQGLINKSALGSINHLSEFGTLDTQQALRDYDLLNCYFPDQVNIHNQAEQNGGGGGGGGGYGDGTTVNSSFYGSTNNRDNNFPSYDQASNQLDDDDFLESLLAIGSFGADDQIQTLDGI